MAKVDNETWIRTVYMAATPAQRVILREAIEQVLATGKDFDEVTMARFRRRLGRPAPALRAALDDLAYRQAVERQ
jgi:hypothetical protein